MLDRVGVFSHFADSLSKDSPIYLKPASNPSPGLLKSIQASFKRQVGSWLAYYAIVPGARKFPGCGLRPEGAESITIDGRLSGCQIFASSPEDAGPANPEPAKGQKWIVYFNGNGYVWEHNYEALKQISKETGANVLSFNYRGVGRSGGAITSAQDLIEDGEAAVQYLLSQGVLPEDIVLHGHSLGGGVATAVVAKHQGMHLVNDRSFSSLSRVVAAIFDPQPGTFLHALIKKVHDVALRFIGEDPQKITKDYAASLVTHFFGDFDSAAAVPLVTGKTLIISSDEDTIISQKARLAEHSDADPILKTKIAKSSLVIQGFSVPEKERGRYYHATPLFAPENSAVFFTKGISKGEKQSPQKTYIEFVKTALHLNSTEGGGAGRA